MLARNIPNGVIFISQSESSTQITYRIASNLLTKLGKSANNIISSKSNHKTYQTKYDSAQ